MNTASFAVTSSPWTLVWEVFTDDSVEMRIDLRDPVSGNQVIKDLVRQPTSGPTEASLLIYNHTGNFYLEIWGGPSADQGGWQITIYDSP